jgi:hypothetical protein
VAGHVIRYDGVDYPATPDIIRGVFQGLNAQVGDGVFAQRLDEIGGGESVILVFGIGVGLTFKTTAALARELVIDTY